MNNLLVLRERFKQIYGFSLSLGSKGSTVFACTFGV